MVDSTTASAPKLKILLLVRDLRPGGVPSLIGPLAHEFMRAGHEVVVYSLGLETEIARPIMDGIRIVSGGRADGSGYRGHLDAFKKWQRFARSYAPDILQSHVGLPDIYAAATRFSGPTIKVRAALAPNLFPAQPVFGFAFERLVSPSGFDHHVAVSSGVARRLKKSGISPNKITEIINPISASVLASLNQKLPETCPFEAVERCQGIRVGYFGRFSREKGPDRIIRWWKQWLPSLPPGSKLFLGGMGAMLPELEASIQELGLSATVQVIGFVAKPQEFLPYLHVVVSPSRYEGLPIAMIEAAALGCRVISTDTDGARALEKLALKALIIRNQDELSQFDLDQMTHFLEGVKLGRDSATNLNGQAQRDVTPGEVARHYLELYLKLLTSKSR